MAVKKIILDFKQQPIVDAHFEYEIYINSNKVIYGNGETEINLSYKNGANVNPNQIGLGATLNDTINNTLSFLNSLYAFSGFVGGFSTTITYARIGNTIEVTITQGTGPSLISFWKMISDFEYVSFKTETPCETVFLTNQSSANAIPIFGFDTGIYNIKNTDLNTNLGTRIPDKFSIEYQRNFSYALQQSGATLINFGFDDALNILNVNAFFSENTLNVNVFQDNLESLGLLYSINGTDYQTESIFADLDLGNYTVYLKDVYGCIKTINVTNNGNTNGNVAAPFYYISESNSLRSVRRVQHQNCGNYKNVFNTLSCEENLPIANRYIQLFQSCDIITEQIKTSYENIEVFTKDTDGNLTELTANKIVNNIQIEDKRDCIYYSFENRLAVLFITGNLYEYDTTTITGTYELNGLLPEYGIVGTWVETAYGIYQIADIRLDDNGQRSLLFNVNISIPDTINGTIQTIYNRDIFNIWQFQVNMNDFLNKTFSIGLRLYQTETDINFPDIFYAYEKIQVKERHPRTAEIVWYNSKNTDIYFYSGIQMKNRLNFCNVNTLVNDGGIENQKTDTQVISIDAVNYNGIDFEVFNLTTGMVRKIILALKHDNLFIENISYKLSENPEITRQGLSNFYTLKAKLLESGDVWNSGTVSGQTISSNTPLIGLLQGDNDAEYIRNL